MWIENVIEQQYRIVKVLKKNEDKEITDSPDIPVITGRSDSTSRMDGRRQLWWCQ